MIHGVGCTGAAWDRMAPLFQARGFTTFTPTLFPALRTKGAPPEGITKLTLHDYVAAMADEARKIAADTGRKPALIGHSMGGLIVQKLATMDVAAAGVLLTPAQTADCQVFDFAPLYTFWNILKSGDVNQPYKVWDKGFSWGVLNAVDKSRHAEIYAEAVFDSGLVYRDLGRPAEDPHRTAFIDAAEIKLPLLTIGAAKDRATVIKAVRRLAQKYAGVGGAYKEYPKNAHWIVDEPGTEQVVSDIADWLDAKVPAA
jgi:alpha-beta hydrolase superfamily lysophospholipase